MIDRIAGKFGLDTAVVLFLLAAEYGRGVSFFSLDGVVMSITAAMVLVLPYFLPSGTSRPNFSNWLAVRSGVLVTGLIGGGILSWFNGGIVPTSVQFLPLTLLVLASMISCYIQFYSLIRVRLVR